MRRMMLSLLAMVLLAAAALQPPPAFAQADVDPALQSLVDDLPKGGYSDRAEVIEALAASGSPSVVPVLNALEAGDLFLRESDNRVVLARKVKGGLLLTDPLSGAELATVETERGLEKIRVNNRLRRTIRDVMGALTLKSPDRAVRMAAAQSIFSGQDADAIPALRDAIEVEKDGTVRQALTEALAAAILASDADEERKLAAIQTLQERGDQDALGILMPLVETDGAVGEAARGAVTAIENSLALWNAGQNIWYGLSLGSVLLLAAIGLAITFGVMGVINMAHGEMVMLGAYTTYVVQEIIRTHMPELFGWSLLIALPLAFVFTGAVGVAIERGIIRFLYGRPLETLLATWGLSLMLQQAVRTIFGPTNKEVGTPDWMSGAIEVGQLSITANRLTIVLFSLAVLAVLMLVLRKTPMGLQMRAVTQNRRMASAMGIRTNWVDAMTFGLGSGIAGIAGVALSQVDNVSPNLGQGYIIDSFMVVVFGGVGNLWGTLVGAMSLGVANKFLEPYAGAVLGKILVLVFIILFIQKRPRGLFALKGRAVDA